MLFELQLRWMQLHICIILIKPYFDEFTISLARREVRLHQVLIALLPQQSVIADYSLPPLRFFLLLHLKLRPKLILPSVPLHF